MLQLYPFTAPFHGKLCPHNSQFAENTRIIAQVFRNPVPCNNIRLLFVKEIVCFLCNSRRSIPWGGRTLEFDQGYIKITVAFVLNRVVRRRNLNSYNRNCLGTISRNQIEAEYRDIVICLLGAVKAMSGGQDNILSDEYTSANSVICWINNTDHVITKWIRIAD